MVAFHTKSHHIFNYFYTLNNVDVCRGTVAKINWFFWFLDTAHKAEGSGFHPIPLSDYTPLQPTATSLHTSMTAVLHTEF